MYMKQYVHMCIDIIHNKFDEKNSHAPVCIQSLTIRKIIFTQYVR